MNEETTKKLQKLLDKSLDMLIETPYQHDNGLRKNVDLCVKCLTADDKGTTIKVLLDGRGVETPKEVIASLQSLLDIREYKVDRVMEALNQSMMAD